jgi:ectoine hydroxylase-related dioxygenase (phytanoyl-CoA dioxygenase family)
MLSYFGPGIGAEKLAAALTAEGAAIVENFVAADLLAHIRRELEFEWPKALRGQDPFTGLNTRRLGGLTVKSPTFAGLLTHPLMMGLCDRILQPHCTLYQLAATQAIEIGAGEPAQRLHRDDFIYSIFPPHPEFEVLFILALTEFTAENGPTRIVPGSHRWEPGRVPQPEEGVSALMSPGSVLFFLGSTWHGGGHNRSTSPRVGVSAKYSLGHLRQEENQFLIAPPEVARTLSPALRGLIGYKVSSPYLGYVLDPELRELFVDFESTYAKSYGVTDGVAGELQEPVEESQESTE